jgi:hypothetical protein
MGREFFHKHSALNVEHPNQKWYGEPPINALSKRRVQLSFASHAETDCSQQDAQISGKTLQDHGAWQSIEGSFIAPSSPFHQECETQAQAQ